MWLQQYIHMIKKLGSMIQLDHSIFETWLYGSRAGCVQIQQCTVGTIDFIKLNT